MLRTFWPLLLLVFVVAACDTPVEPTSIDEDNDITINNFISIGGDHNHSDDGKGDGDDPANRPPVLVLPATVTSDVGESVTVDLLASDPDGDDVQISFDPQSAPRDCSITSIGPSAARLSCLISSSSPGDSPYTVRVTATDNNGGNTVGFFIWIVNASEEV